MLEDSFSGVAQGQVAVKGFERPQAAYSLESNDGGRVVAGSGQGYRVRVDLKSLDAAGRAELRDVLSRTLEALDED